jgi:uncharacterized BrkB/YihY/UPF0761 family membrane protein
MSSRDRSDDPEQLELPPPRRTLLRRVTAWAERARGLRRWIEAARRRWAIVDATFEAIERDSEIGGVILAGALSYRLFVFALPLAFFLVSGLGLLASALGKEPNLIVNSVGFAGVITKQIESASKGSSNWWVALSSFFVLAYATRVLLRAVAIVHSLAWNRSAAAVKVSARSLGVFGAVVVGQLALVAAIGAIAHRTAIGGIFAVAAFVFALAGLWLIVSLRVAHAGARWTQLIPGSLLYAIGIVCIVLFNVLILDQLLKEKSSTYGALGIAAALLLGFFFMGRVIVGAAVLNVTLYERRGRREPRPQDSPVRPHAPSRGSSR